MQLNFINNLNTCFEASLTMSRSLVEINSGVIQQLLESNLKLLRSNAAATSEVQKKPKARFKQFDNPFGIGANVTAEFLECRKAAAQILVNSRQQYENWAVESAAQLGMAWQHVV